MANDEEESVGKDNECKADEAIVTEEFIALFAELCCLCRLEGLAEVAARLTLISS